MRRFDPIALLSLTILPAAWALSRWGYQEATVFEPFLRLLVAGAVALVLPGALLLRLLGSDSEQPEEDGLGWLASSFGLSFVVLSALCVAVTLLHGNIVHGVWFIFGTLFLGALLVQAGRRRGSLITSERAADPDGQSGRWIDGLIVLGLAGLAALLYVIGGMGTAAPDGEEALHLLMARKLFDNPAIALDNVFYKPATETTYVFLPYHFLLALLSKIAGMDPFLVFVKSRFLWGILSVACLYAIAKHLFGSRTLARFAALFFLAVLWSGRGGHWIGAFARFAPVSHHADVSLGLLLPLGILFMIRFLRKDGGRLFSVVAPLLLIAITITHTREGLQFLMYLASFLAGCLLFRYGGEGAWKRALILVLILVAFGFAYHRVHAGAASHLAEWEQAEKTQAREMLKQAVRKPMPMLLGRPLIQDSIYLTGYHLIRHPYLWALVFLTPLLLMARHTFWGILLALGIWVPLFLARLPILTVVSILATYSQFLFTFIRYLMHWAYLFFALLIFGWVVLIDRLAVRWEAFAPSQSRAQRFLRGGGWAVTAMLGMVIVLRLIHGASGAVGEALVNPLLILLVLGVAWLVVEASLKSWSEKIPAPPDPLAGCRFRSPVLAWCVSLAVVGVLATDIDPPKARKTWERTLWQQVELARSKERPDPVRFVRWYEQARPFDFSYRFYSYIRDRVPRQKVFACVPDYAFRIPAYFNQYVFTFGSFFSTEIEFVDRYYELTGRERPSPNPAPRLYRLVDIYNKEVLGSFPIFSEQESFDRTLTLLDGFAIDYLIASPAHAKRFQEFRAKMPGVLEPVFEDEGYTLYRVDRRGAARTLEARGRSR